MATFPILNTILRIYLSLPISNAGGERPIGHSLGRQKLNSLSILHIEKNVLNNSSDYEKLKLNFRNEKIQTTNVIFVFIMC